MKVIALCGKLCSGKTTYANSLKESLHAVILSVDAFMLSIFGSDAGADHDRYVEGLTKALYATATDIACCGTPVILDTGLWTLASRVSFRTYFASRGVPCEIHYLSVPDKTWEERIAKRNAEVKAGRSDAYFVDEGLLSKFREAFEVPAPDEVDCILTK
ncbi:MAG: ATP-binding protein [Clostridia bacterium]|nr:ATP-binding protein [Clostridia bacterium]MBR1685755.1 ATP-binding protein [Clostridia bacterium]